MSPARWKSSRPNHSTANQNTADHSTTILNCGADALSASARQRSDRPSLGQIRALS